MFTKKRIVALVLATVMSMSMVLTSCTTVASKYPGTPEAGSVTVDIQQEPPKLNSILTSDVVSMNVLRHTVEGLTTLDKEDKPIPGIAKGWKISDDGLTYTFNLNDSYKWSNGDTVTAKDFEFAFESLIDPKFAATYASLGFIFKNAKNFYDGKASIDEVGIKAVDDSTLELTLENPIAYMLDLMAFVVFLPVNQKAYDAQGDKYATDFDKMLYNGPYTMTKWVHEDQIVLTKNPNYPHAKDIKIDTIVMKMMSDSNTRMNSFKAGEIDMIELLGDQAIALNAEKQPVITYDDGSNWYVQYNLKSKTLSNQKLRQALTYSIDSEAYVRDIVKNTSKKAEQMTPLTINGNKKKFAEEIGTQFKSHDIEKAKQLLEEAKKELGVDTFKFKLLGGSTDFAKASLAYFQEMWKKELGIEIEVVAQPFKSRLKIMEDNDFDMVMAGWSPDYNDPLTFLDMFESFNPNNYGKYNSPAYDKLIADSRVETDRDKRFALLMDAEKLLLSDMAVGPYYFKAKDYTVSGKLTGSVRTAFQDMNLRWAEVK
ncbi:MAG: peptide ABC transporter substrate-binding protein [Oscillospiraceae bacterium]